MSYEDDKRRVEELLKRIEPASHGEALAWKYLREYEAICQQILASGATALMIQRLVEEAHTRYLGRLCNLFDPMDQPEPTVVPDSSSAEETAIGLSLDFHELLQALAGIVAAWDACKPIGWVASAKGDPRLITQAITVARLLVIKNKCYLPH